MTPSDPRYETVALLLHLLGVTLNPAMFYDTSRADGVMWAADREAARLQLEREIAMVLRMGTG